jgi:hypothetical protein
VTAIHLGALSLDVPGGYVPRMLVLAGPEETYGAHEKPFLRSVVLKTEPRPKGKGAEQIAEEHLTALTKHMTGFQKVRRHTVIIHGEACPMVEATTRTASGAMLTNLIAFCVSGDLAISLSAAHLTGPRFERVRKEFAAIFESLTVRQAA